MTVFKSDILKEIEFAKFGCLKISDFVSSKLKTWHQNGEIHFDKKYFLLTTPSFVGNLNGLFLFFTQCVSADFLSA